MKILSIFEPQIEKHYAYKRKYMYHNLRYFKKKVYQLFDFCNTMSFKFIQVSVNLDSSVPFGCVLSNGLYTTGIHLCLKLIPKESSKLLQTLTLNS